ncbi:MAG: hypothetical protein ABFS16_11120 [Bacteroidota bacterium]
MKLRIHHFFDIIRDFGTGNEILPHSYGHAYHMVANSMRNNAELELELVVASDEVCFGCLHLVNGNCDDLITNRLDFKGKEDFNNYLDKRILQVCEIDITKKYTPKVLCKIAAKYIENIEFIYDGNDSEHNKKRKEAVIKGLNYYTKKNRIQIGSDDELII